MVPELRKEEILKSIKKRDISYIKDLAAELNISLSTVRRDVAALEQEGSVIVMRGGAVKYKAEDFDEPVVKKKLIHSEEKERLKCQWSNHKKRYSRKGLSTHFNYQS